MTIRFGDAAFLLELPDGADRAAILAALRAVPNVVDVVVTERQVCVSFEPDRPPVLPDLATIPPSVAAPPRHHVIRVRYDGPDLSDLGLPRAEVIAMHAGRDYTVRVVGFMPGFAYLGDVDPRLRRPRRASPRPRVPVLSVAIAERYTAVYPFASSGGWNLIGTAADFTPLDAAGATLRLGDVVRFEPA